MSPIAKLEREVRELRRAKAGSGTPRHAPSPSLDRSVVAASRGRGPPAKPGVSPPEERAPAACEAAVPPGNREENGRSPAAPVQLPPPQQRANPGRDGDAAHCPDCSSGSSPDQSAAEIGNRREDHRRAGSAARPPERAGPRRQPALTHPAHDGKHRAAATSGYVGRHIGPSSRSPSPLGSATSSTTPQASPASSESTAEQHAEQRQVPWRAAQDPGGLRHGDQGPSRRRGPGMGPSAWWRPARSRQRPGPAMRPTP